MPCCGQSVPLAYAARVLRRLGLQTAARGLCGAGADGADEVGGEGEGQVNGEKSGDKIAVQS